MVRLCLHDICSYMTKDCWKVVIWDIS